MIAADCSDDWADSSESLCVPLYGPPADRTKTPPDRTQKVKDARSEAQKEIEAYKKQKESEFKKFEAEVCLPSLSSLPSKPRLQC